MKCGLFVASITCNPQNWNMRFQATNFVFSGPMVIRFTIFIFGSSFSLRLAHQFPSDRAILQILAVEARLGCAKCALILWIVCNSLETISCTDSDLGILDDWSRFSDGWREMKPTGRKAQAACVCSLTWKGMSARRKVVRYLFFTLKFGWKQSMPMAVRLATILCFGGMPGGSGKAKLATGA